MPSSPTQSPGLDEAQGRWLEAWKKSEDIAVHFNQLIINFRLQALGGVTVAGGLVGTVLLAKDGVSLGRANYVAFCAGMVFLAVIWLAICIIDFGYYHRLLVGAVAEAERLEKQTNGAITLSLVISEKAKSGVIRDDTARKWFYALPLTAFGLAAVLAGSAAWRDDSARGCAQDSDCKADRICVSHACGDPPAKK